jgi:adenylylsulfate kinase-like enzyme
MSKSFAFCNLESVDEIQMGSRITKTIKNAAENWAVHCIGFVSRVNILVSERKQTSNIIGNEELDLEIYIYMPIHVCSKDY